MFNRVHSCVPYIFLRKNGRGDYSVFRSPQKISEFTLKFSLKRFALLQDSCIITVDYKLYIIHYNLLDNKIWLGQEV